MADGVKEVCLTKARPSVDKQRVVGAGWLFGHSDSSRVCKTVAGSDDKGVERVFVIQSAVFIARARGSGAWAQLFVAPGGFGRCRLRSVIV